MRCALAHDVVSLLRRSKQNAANAYLSNLALVSLVGAAAIGSFHGLGQSAELAITGQTEAAHVTSLVGSRAEAGLASVAADAAKAGKRLTELTRGKYRAVPLKLQRFDDVEGFQKNFTAAVQQTAKNAPQHEVAEILGGGERGRLVADGIRDIYENYAWSDPAHLDIDSIDIFGPTALLDALQEAAGRGNQNIFDAKFQRGVPDEALSATAEDVALRVSALRDIFSDGITRSDRADHFGGLLVRNDDVAEIVELEKTFRLDRLKKLFAAYDDEASDALFEDLVLPYIDPALSAELGMRSEQGILLYGPQRTGKTYLAKGIANFLTSEENIKIIKGSEMDNQFVGNTGEKMRELFGEAVENATADKPYVVILDEVDGVIPNDPLSGGNASRRSAFLSAMADAIEENEHVIVIGTTNKHQTLDPALRGPGRFSTEIRIGYPTDVGRDAIIRGAVDDKFADLSVRHMVKNLDGYNVADILKVLRKTTRKAGFGILFGESDRARHIVTADFAEALSQVEPTALRQNTIRMNPDITFDNIGGYTNVIEEVKRRVMRPLTNPELYENVGRKDPLPGSLLLDGPPGTGKTLLANAIANEADVNIISISASDLRSVEDVKAVFDRARNAQPALVFIDELDAVAAKRGQYASSFNDRVVNQLLTEMQGFEKRGRVAVIGTTNRRDLLDPAILRRFQVKEHMPVINDPAVRSDILRIQTRDLLATGKDAPDLDAIARETEHFSGADLSRLVDNAVEYAVDRKADSINGDDFRKALAETTPDVHPSQYADYTPSVTGAQADGPVNKGNPIGFTPGHRVGE